ncbi:MAG: fimbrial assembly protein FimA [Chloroflexi bacterium]|nr:MAG: fimbrial assembly protein FimA [Chloroflexota bacterium]
MRHKRTPKIATFSIVARDPASGDLGIAVASKFLAVGAGVPHARANIGAIATQADTNMIWGSQGLGYLAEGATAQETIERLVASDPGAPGGRQVGVVDAHGNAATLTGPDAMYWAGGRTGPGFACQGNILAGPEVVDAMVEAYTSSHESFPWRLLAALEAGDAAGGDSRGRQAAAMLIVRDKGGYGGLTDRWLDLRVDDHQAPIPELRRLVGLHDYYFNTDNAVLTPLDDGVTARIASHLTIVGELTGPADRAAIERALERWVGKENLEMRLRSDGQIDTVILNALALAAGATPANG